MTDITAMTANKGNHPMTARSISAGSPHSSRTASLRISVSTVIATGLLTVAATPAYAECTALGRDAALVAGGLVGTFAICGGLHTRVPETKQPEYLQKKAITDAEAAVAKSPRDAALRAALGHAYLRAGRFESAAGVLADAQALGDSTGRTALALALAQTAIGKGHDAIEVLDSARAQMPVADYGLAVALAGDGARGVAVLTDDLHAGDKAPMLRENLAYAYALDGRWGEARSIVTMDLPADKVDGRITQWASTAQPEAYRNRVAALLGAPVRDDAGMPAQLALNAAPASTQMAMATPAARPVPNQVQGELPAVDGPPATPAATAPVAATPVIAAPVLANNAAPAPQIAAPQTALPQTALPQTDRTALAVATPPPAAEMFTPNAQAPEPIIAAPTFASVHAVPMAPSMPISGPHAASKHVHAEFASAFPMQPTHKSAHLAPAHQNKVAPAADAFAHVAMQMPVGPKNGGHNVQLGSFSSQQNAERARKLALAKDADLAQRHIAITSAVVKGRTFWRVTASGFDTASAEGACGAIRHQGGACWAYEASHLAPSLAVADTNTAGHHAQSARAHRR